MTSLFDASRASLYRVRVYDTDAKLIELFQGSQRHAYRFFADVRAAGSPATVHRLTANASRREIAAGHACLHEIMK